MSSPSDREARRPIRPDELRLQRDRRRAFAAAPATTGPAADATVAPARDRSVVAMIGLVALALVGVILVTVLSAGTAGLPAEPSSVVHGE